MPLEIKGGLAASAEDQGDMPKAAPATEYLRTGAGLKFHLFQRPRENSAAARPILRSRRFGNRRWR
jgi:hypothetical protein